METANARLQRHGGNPFVRRRGAGAYLRLGDRLGLAEAFCRQTNNETGDATLAHQKIGTDTDNRQRDIFRHGFQKCRKVFLVGRLEQRLGGAAGAEPGYLFHFGAGRDAAAQSGQPVAEFCKQGFAADHAASSASSFGRAYAHWVMLPAPRKTTKSPALASSRTAGAIAC